MKSTQDKAQVDPLQLFPSEIINKPVDSSYAGAKPAWVDKFGNISQITSALSAIVFGIIAAAISLQLADIQRQNVLTAEVARDRDAVYKYRDKISANYVKWRRSLECFKAVFSTTKAPTLFGVEDYNFTPEVQKRGLFSQTAIKNCGEKNSKDAEAKSEYYLQLAEQTLFAWGEKIQDERKEIYDYHFQELCFGPVRMMNDYGMFWIRHYARVSSFIKYCNRDRIEFLRGKKVRTENLEENKSDR